MNNVDFPLPENEIKATVFDGKTYLQFPLEVGEKIFGLGLNFKTVEQRGRILRLHVDHYGGEDNGRTHAPVPFYVSSKGYDFYTGKLAGEAQVISVSPGLDRIPVYVRDGGIIPMKESTQIAQVSGEKDNLIIRFYGTKEASYMLYDDDGETFDYEKGAFSWREIRVLAGKEAS